MIEIALPSKELKRLKLLLEFIDTSILCKILNDNINKKNVMGIFLNKVSSLYISEESNKVIIDSDVVDSNVSKTTARMYIAVLESIREASDTHALSDSLFIIGGDVPVMVSTIPKNHLEYQDAMDILRNDGVYTDKAIRFAHNICKMNVAGALDYKIYKGGNKNDKGI